jgi:hypothetical protein
MPLKCPETAVFERVEQVADFLRQPERMLLADLNNGSQRGMDE